jgi:hypothetical protein
MKPAHHSVLVSLLVALVLLFASYAAAQPETTVTNVENYPVAIEYEPGDEKVADKVSEICAESIPRLAGELGLTTLEPFHVLLVADIEAFQSHNQIRLPQWGIAFAFMENQLMVVDVKRATTSWNSLERVIPHELSHLLVAQKVGAVAMPRWFVEGLAMWQAREWSLLDNWRLMEAVWGNRAPGLGHITHTMPPYESGARDAYRVAYRGFTARFDDGMDALPAFLEEIARADDFSLAFSNFWTESEYDYYGRFNKSLYRRYKSRLLLFQAGPLFSVVAVLFLFVVLRIRIRNRKKLRKMEDIDRGLTFDD